ncbi:MAG TPA: prepilin peptidase [Gemmatales bacterium]|nr:prepilin peptidase [Gemmatales bacterium]
MFDVISFLYRPLEYPLALVPVIFIFGAMVGSFLNVSIYRIPLEKSLWWPSSHCGNCYQPVRKLDNLPLISYWLLKGRCRTCHVKYSSRYFWIELFTALLFAGTFYYYLTLKNQPDSPYARVPSLSLFLIWLYHITFLCFLIVATFTDFDHMEIPLRLTIPGTIIGIVGGSFVGWPWPLDIQHPEVQQRFMGGLHYWPFWAPLSDVTLPFLSGPPQPNAWYVGFLTSLIGALAGTGLIRLIRSLFSWAYEREAMGLGDADLLMLIGAFLGWQSLVLVMAYAIMLGLLYFMMMFLFKGSSEFPFGPMLAGGAALVLFDFIHLHDFLQGYLFNSLYVAIALFFFIFLCFNACMIIRFLRVGLRPLAKVS